MRLKLPNRVAELRQKRELKMVEVARAVQVNPSQISKLERSEIPLNQDWMERLAPVIGCDPWEFFPQWAERSPAEHILRMFHEVDPAARAELLETLANGFDHEAPLPEGYRLEHGSGTGMNGAAAGSRLVHLRVSDNGAYDLTIFYRRGRDGRPGKIKVDEKS